VRTELIDKRLTTRAEHVFWRGIEVEHINIDAQETYDWQRLIDRCLHLERLSIQPRSTTVIWHWEWFETMPRSSIYKPLMQLTPGFWEHGCTMERSQILSAANCGWTKVAEPDGSIAVSYRGQVITWDGVEARPLSYDETIEEDQGFYHAMRAVRYNPAQMGQPVHNGPSYATYEQVEAWLDNHLVGLGGVVAITRALGLEP